MSRILCLLSILCLLFLEACFWAYTADDTYIDMRYAENLVAGHGLRWNVGETPVEGYSNFLWVLWMAFLMKAGVDVIVAVKLTEVALSVASLFVLHKLAKRLIGDRPLAVWPVMLLAATPGYAFWAIGGLATHLFVFWMLVAYYFFFRELDEPQSFPTSAFFFALLALTRHEGAMIFAVSAAFKPICLYLAAPRAPNSPTHPHAHPPIRPVLGHMAAWLLLFCLLYAPYFVWRVGYYGDVLPNTFYAKTKRSGGMDYILSFLRYTGPFLALAALSFIVRPARAMLTRPVCSLYFLLIMAIGMLVMVDRDIAMGYYFRYFMYLFPPIYILSTPMLVLLWDKLRAWRPRWATPLGLVAAALLLLWVLEPRETMRLRNWYRNYGIALRAAHVELGKWLRVTCPPNATLALIDCGAVPYYSKRRTVDLLGLNDAQIARRGFTLDYFWSRSPDVVVLTTRSPNTIQPYTAVERDILGSKEFQTSFEFARMYRWTTYDLLVFGRRGLLTRPNPPQKN
ncbi:MAG: glycosyltransferase family 39 protein [Planctomycetes bacterium]|nr:glycosyltransferase family 39 protein [Planctomycetota bacterium]